jgi:hypothetical protein
MAYFTNYMKRPFAVVIIKSLVVGQIPTPYAIGGYSNGKFERKILSLKELQSLDNVSQMLASFWGSFLKQKVPTVFVYDLKDHGELVASTM